MQEISKTISLDFYETHKWGNVACMSPKVFYYVTGSHVEIILCFLSLSTRQPGNYFGFFCPCTRVSLKEIRVLWISFPCAVLLVKFLKPQRKELE